MNTLSLRHMKTGTTALPYGGLACALGGGSPSSLRSSAWQFSGEGPGRAFSNVSDSLPCAGFAGHPGDRRNPEEIP